MLFPHVQGFWLGLQLQKYSEGLLAEGSGREHQLRVAALRGLHDDPICPFAEMGLRHLPTLSHLGHAGEESTDQNSKASIPSLRLAPLCYIFAFRRDFSIMDDSRKPVTIVVIGPTQNGKSTFINFARSLSIGDTTPPAGEGDGSLSFTMACEVKELLIPRTTYKLIDPSNGRSIPIPDNEEDIFGLLWKKKRYQVVPEGSEKPPTRLRIIDTPGLDDSRGLDAQHIQKVLQAVVKEPYITAIAFICNVNNSFSDGFQGIYEYYSQCMPNLMAPGALAVINTNFSVTTWQQKHERYSEDNYGRTKGDKSDRLVGALTEHANALRLSSRPKSAKEIVVEERRKAFKKIFRKDPVHFFIDSKPDKRSPFEQMVSRNAFVEILNFLSEKGDMPTGQMNLHKNADMRAVDHQLAQLLFAAKTNWQTEQASMQQLALNNGEKMIKTRTFMSKQVGEQNNEIDSCEKELARLDNDTEYPLTPNITTHDDTSMANRIWKGATGRKFRGTRVITEHSVPKFFVEATSNSNSSRWTNTSSNPVYKTWRGEYEADWGKIPDLTARTYTYNRYWYAERVETLENRVQKARIDLLEYEQRLAELEPADSELESPESKRIRVLTGLIVEAEKLMKTLSAESVPLDEGFDELAQRRYRKMPSEINEKDLHELIQANSPELAAKWIGVK
jgi:hypothetical protein